MRRRGAFGAVWAVAVVPILAAAGVLTLGGCASCQSTVRQLSVPALAGASFDGVEADPTAHRLYLADGTNSKIAVVDTTAADPRFVGTIDPGGTPKGLAVAPELHRLYAGVSGGTLAVIDTDPSSPTYLQVINQIKVDPATADLIDYSPRLHRVFVGTATEVVSVDVIGTESEKRFDLKGPVGQPRFNPADGMLYVTTLGQDSLVKINPSDGKVMSTFKLAGCRPNGLAINPSREFALTTCRSSVAVVNLKNHAYDVSRAVAGGDIVSYDATVDRFVVASPHGPKDSTVSVFYGDGTLLGSVAGTPESHGAAFDVAHGVVYAPAAAGLMSLVPGACEPPPDGVRFATGMSFFLVPLLAFAFFLFLYARRLRRGGPKLLTYEELRRQDLDMERERMQELEDAILGPLSQELRPEA